MSELTNDQLKGIGDRIRERLKLNGELDPALAIEELFQEYERECAERQKCDAALKSFSETVCLTLVGSAERAPADVIEKLEERLTELAKLRSDYKALFETAHALCSNRADDRCYMDEEKLCHLVGVSFDPRVGDKAAMLANCQRYVNVRCAEGAWPSYRDLERIIRGIANTECYSTETEPIGSPDRCPKENDWCLSCRAKEFVDLIDAALKNPVAPLPSVLGRQWGIWHEPSQPGGFEAGFMRDGTGRLIHYPHPGIAEAQAAESKSDHGTFAAKEFLGEL